MWGTVHRHLTFELIDAPSAIVGKTLIFNSTVSDKQLHWTCVGGAINHQRVGVNSNGT